MVLLDGPSTWAQFGVTGPVAYLVDSVRENGSWLYLAGCWIGSNGQPAWTRDVRLPESEVKPPDALTPAR